MKIKRILTITFLLLFLFQMLVYASDPIADQSEFEDYQITDIDYDVPTTRTVGLVVKQFSLGKTVDGKLSVGYTTIASTTAAEIGVEDMRLQQRTWYGSWETIRSTSPVSYNSSGNAGGYYYLNPSAGTTYRVVGTHYAVINGVRYEEFHIGGSFTY